MNWAGRCHSSAPFFVTRAPMMSFQCLYDVIPVLDTGIQFSI
ncbi:hypothetical protein [Wolbachia endosymbiont of Rhagoletis cerasi]|nr:hypothetical protein [Wolbachia endosymbiont of Rhagoletis cerasi]